MLFSSVWGRCRQRCTTHNGINHCRRGDRCNTSSWMERASKSVITHKLEHMETLKHALPLTQFVSQPPGSVPLSSHQRILISSMAQWEIIDTTIIHLSCLNVNPMLGSLRIHHVIRGMDRLFTTCRWTWNLITAVIQGIRPGLVRQWWIRCVGAPEGGGVETEVRDFGRMVWWTFHPATSHQGNHRFGSRSSSVLYGINFIV